jgi:hypothetical protein
LIPEHVALVAHRRERGGELELVEQPGQFGAQQRNGVAESRRLPDRLGDVRRVLRVELAEQLQVLGFRAEEPRLGDAARPAGQPERLAQRTIPLLAGAVVPLRRHGFGHVGGEIRRDFGWGYVAHPGLVLLVPKRVFHWIGAAGEGQATLYR